VRQQQSYAVFGETNMSFDYQFGESDAVMLMLR
jgi:hypothetical protein